MSGHGFLIQRLSEDTPLAPGDFLVWGRRMRGNAATEFHVVTEVSPDAFCTKWDYDHYHGELRQITLARFKDPHLLPAKTPYSRNRISEFLRIVRSCEMEKRPR